MTPPASISATAPAPSGHPIRLAVRVRRPTETFTAYQLQTAETLKLPTTEVYGRPGEWVVARGSQVIDVLPEALYKQRYESAEKHSLTLPESARGQIDRALGLGASETPQALLAAIERLARLTIGNVQIDFTPGQWEELAHRSQKRGIRVEALVRQIVDKITADLWTT